MPIQNSGEHFLVLWKLHANAFHLSFGFADDIFLADNVCLLYCVVRLGGHTLALVLFDVTRKRVRSLIGCFEGALWRLYLQILNLLCETEQRVGLVKEQVLGFHLLRHDHLHVVQAANVAWIDRVAVLVTLVVDLFLEVFSRLEGTHFRRVETLFIQLRQLDDCLLWCLIERVLFLTRHNGEVIAETEHLLNGRVEFAALVNGARWLVLDACVSFFDGLVLRVGLAAGDFASVLAHSQ